jgi:hypothetical protein
MNNRLKKGSLLQRILVAGATLLAPTGMAGTSQDYQPSQEEPNKPLILYNERDNTYSLNVPTNRAGDYVINDKLTIHKWIPDGFLFAKGAFHPDNMTPEIAKWVNNNQDLVLSWISNRLDNGDGFLDAMSEASKLKNPEIENEITNIAFANGYSPRQ